VSSSRALASTSEAAAPVAAGSAAPTVSISNLTGGQEIQLGFQEIDGNTIPLRMEVAANVEGNQYTEVTFAVRAAGTEDFTVIGVDDNAPYRVFYDASQWPAGTQLEFLAVTNDLNGHYSGAFVGGITANYTQQPEIANYRYAVVHYQRSDGDYGDPTTGNYNDFWGLHVWGTGVLTPTEWTQPVPFLGEDDYGRFAWIELSDATQDIGFIVHRGDTKDTDADRFFNPTADGPEIWLKQGDGAVDADRVLEQDRTGIDAVVDEVDGDAEDAHAVGDGLADGVEAGEGGQQRRMDVDDPVAEGGDEARAEDRHVAGRDDGLGAVGR